MELRHLRYFVVLAEELHFGRTASRLHIVQPAVTQQIQRLERELGVKLFDRSGRQVALTVAGRRLLPQAQRVIDAVDEIPALVSDSGLCAAKSLRIGTIGGLGTRLNTLLDRLLSTDPEIRVSLSAKPLGERLRQVRSGKLDAAFVRALTASEGLQFTLLWEDPLLALLPAGHPAAASVDVDLALLAEIPLRIVSSERNPPFVGLVAAACRAAGFEPVSGPVFTTLQDTVAEIGTGSPSWTVIAANQEAQPMGPRVRALPIRPAVAVTTSLVTNPERTPLVDLLLACCREAVSSAPAQ